MPQSILIVDDEAGIRDSLSSILTEEGYAVESVGSGEECLSRLAKQHVDLVLLDVWLPKMDGIETLERMRRDGHFPMVVMISGHGNIETAVRATKLGAFDFVEKPLSLEKTTQSVANLGYHAHIYYEPERTRAIAERLCAALGEKLLSFAGKFVFCRRLLVSSHDKSSHNKLIKNLPFICIQIRTPSFQYIAKDRNFLVTYEGFCHDTVP